MRIEGSFLITKFLIIGMMTSVFSFDAELTVAGRLARSICEQRQRFLESGLIQPHTKKEPINGYGDCMDYKSAKKCSNKISPCPKAFLAIPCASPDGNRIIGGEITQPYQYPSFVHVFDIEGRGGCGGVIIHKNFITTAAHCLQKPKCTQYSITAGSWNRNQTENEQTRRIVKIAIHPKYHSGGNKLWANYDVAIGKLESPLELNDRVAISPLPTQLVDKGRFMLIGFGIIDGYRKAEVMHQVEMPALSHPECQKRAPKVPFAQPMMCMYKAGGGVGACYGDSGSPLFQIEADTGRQNLVGVASFVTGKRCAEADTATVYQKLYYFVDWLRTFMESN